MNLTAHFTLGELTFSEGALRHGIDNTPPQNVIEDLKKLCLVLERVRGITGQPIKVTSGYRNFETNKLVGGSSNSAHLFGLAADIQCHEFGSALDLCKLIESSDIQFDQLIHEYKSWCHLAISDNPRRISLTKNHGHKYQLGLL